MQETFQERHSQDNSTPHSHVFLNYNLAVAEGVVQRARTSDDKRGRNVASNYDPKKEASPVAGIHGEEGGYRSAGYEVDRQSSGNC